MSDDEKLPPGKANKMIKAWLNNEQFSLDDDKNADKDEPANTCYHYYVDYTGLFHTESYCRYCNKKKPKEAAKEETGWPDYDDNSSIS